MQQAKDELSLIEDYYRSFSGFGVMGLEYRIWEGPKIDNP